MTRRRKRRRCCCHVVIVVVCSNTSVLFPPHGVRKYSVVGLCVFVWVCQQGFGDRGTHVVADMIKKTLKSKENLGEATITKINGLISDLDKADEGMMDWMNGFQQLKKLQAEKNHQEILTYLEEQDAVIKQVGVDMTNSIKAGMDFVESME